MNKNPEDGYVSMYVLPVGIVSRSEFLRLGPGLDIMEMTKGYILDILLQSITCSKTRPSYRAFFKLKFQLMNWILNDIFTMSKNSVVKVHCRK